MEEDDLSLAPTKFDVHPDDDMFSDDESVAPPNMTRTENGAATYTTSGDALVDFFFNVVPTIGAEEFERLLEEAWQQNKPASVRLVFQVGNCRKGEVGKCDKENFLRGLFAIWKKDPDVIFANLGEIVKHSSYGTLLRFLELVVAGPHVRDDQRVRRCASSQKTGPEKRATSLGNKRAFAAKLGKNLEELMTTEGRRKWKSAEIRDRYALFIVCRAREAALVMRAEKKMKRDECKANAGDAAKECTRMVARIFVSGLLADMDAAQKGQSVPGLAAKWAPNVGGAVQRNTGAADEIREQLSTHLEEIYNFLRPSTCEYSVWFTGDVRTNDGTLTRRGYSTLVTKLRRLAEIPETMCAQGDFGKVNYRRMSGMCRNQKGPWFLKKDTERYNAFLQECKDALVKQAAAGKPAKNKVNVGGVLPHEVRDKHWESSPKHATDIANGEMLRPRTPVVTLPRPRADCGNVAEKGAGRGAAVERPDPTVSWPGARERFVHDGTCL